MPGSSEQSGWRVADEIAPCLRQLGSTRKKLRRPCWRTVSKGVPNTVRMLNPVVRFVQICLKIEGLDMDVIPGNTLRYGVGKQKQEVALAKP